ncbi:Low-affinity inorganic phosphate transporter 1 [Buchnera aphidicola (Eriosoma grossulariae)]|uniref:inorganic phosphate transporter n=1 Tax=Buchnera aphidicola TaxID=9 RepID=UPI00346455E3
MLFSSIFIFDFHSFYFLILSLIFVCVYEIVNGFHDIANSVITVIYTRSMSSNIAVIMASVFNFFGVILGGLSIAYTIVHLLPIEVLLNLSFFHRFLVIFFILLVVMLLNLFSWYYRLPSSSSHALIGSIIGIGFANSILFHCSLLNSINVIHIKNIFIVLICSPFFGFFIALFFVFLLRSLKMILKYNNIINMDPVFYKNKFNKTRPPFLIQMTLILSAIGLSYAHGSNDGQKSIGLIMLILMSILPGYFVLNLNSAPVEIIHTQKSIKYFKEYYQLNNLHAMNSYSVSIKKHFYSKYSYYDDPFLSSMNYVNHIMNNVSNYRQLGITERIYIHRLLLLISNHINKKLILSNINQGDKIFLKKLQFNILKSTEYAPLWIIFMVAFFLSIGSIIGWRRISVTIGKKIGQKNMTYGQAISIQMTSSISIGLANYVGFPVSTTHISSSAVMGVMLISRGGIQLKTVKNIFLAWVLTIPISIFLSGLLYWMLFKIL